MRSDKRFQLIKCLTESQLNQADFIYLDGIQSIGQKSQYIRRRIQHLQFLRQSFQDKKSVGSSYSVPSSVYGQGKPKQLIEITAPKINNANRKTYQESQQSISLFQVQYEKENDQQASSLFSIIQHSDATVKIQKNPEHQDVNDIKSNCAVSTSNLQKMKGMKGMKMKLISEMSQTLKPKTNSEIQREQKAETPNLNFYDLNGISNEFQLQYNKKLQTNIFDQRKSMQETQQRNAQLLLQNNTLQNRLRANEEKINQYQKCKTCKICNKHAKSNLSS